ncbi:hypothetical protein MHYP_G00060480 [Metynnis hypsauchen]
MLKRLLVRKTHLQDRGQRPGEDLGGHRQCRVHGRNVFPCCGPVRQAVWESTRDPSINTAWPAQLNHSSQQNR